MAEGKAKDEAEVVQLGGNAKTALKTIVERVERLDDDRLAVVADIKEVYAEAKGSGFDVKTIRKIVALRRKDEGKRKEEQQMLDLYAHALGFDLV